MKKQYVKPYLAVESFQLVAALAAGCADKKGGALNQSISSCDSDDGLFASTQCDPNVYDMEWYIGATGTLDMGAIDGVYLES